MFFNVVLITFIVRISLCSSLNSLISTNQLKGLSHTRSTSIPATKRSYSTTRFLRFSDASKHDDIDDNSEERAGVSGIAWLGNLASKWALKNTRNPMQIFKLLRTVKTGGKLEGDKEFVWWLLYVNRYRAKLQDKASFSDDKLFDLVRKLNSEEELVSLFQSLRHYPDIKNIADDMQAYLILSSASSHRLMNEAWLKFRETPEVVFNILRLEDEPLYALDGNPLFIQWLRYIKAYRAVNGGDSFTDVHVFDFLHEFASLPRFGIFLQSLKDIPDLKKLAKRFTNADWLTPSQLEKIFGSPYPINFAELPKSDARYRNLESFTAYFAEYWGGTALS
ncbi:secreted RxLR effector peptide protein, putative [Phytophthora infestans T30-4]|uniref:RXLR domain-containing protein WY n=2 Tax=Phytophthora infestans TaxID=4787 RepID=A0A833SZQ5_PHYIN